MKYRRSTSPLTGRMPFSRRRTILATARPWLLGTAMVASAWLGLPSAQAQNVAATQLRWQSDLKDFASADKAQPPARNGVLFVGSSTIRMWQTMAKDFQQVPVVINRGFGGSTLADCHQYVRELVIQYQPRQVMVYAGDNDLAEGRTPEQVLESFTHFVEAVRGELPSAQITYISIKPSPSRASLLPAIRATNAMIGKYLTSVRDSEYIDIYTPMLKADGEMRPELFQADMLHMNESGYALWRSVIAPHLSASASEPQLQARIAGVR